jgi:ABC-type multidrug transport system ATPase subunit
VLESAVHRVLDSLALLHIADSRIGTPDSGGISGGERKRVQLAQELVCDPALVLCDEPTSGLDSNNAELVVKVCIQLTFPPSSLLLSCFESHRSARFTHSLSLRCVLFCSVAHTLSHTHTCTHTCTHSHPPTPALTPAQLLRHTTHQSLASCIMTIHQPPASVLALFDKILLLSRRGELVYFGPTNEVQKYMVDWVGLHKPHKVKNPKPFLGDKMLQFHSSDVLQWDVM